MRENFKRFTVASGAVKASRVPKTVGSFHFPPPQPFQYLLLWHCLLIEFMYKISQTKLCLPRRRKKVPKRGGATYIKWGWQKAATHVCD